MYFPKTGSRYVSETGNVARAEGRIGASHNGFVVEELLIGDFDYDGSQFVMESLPIPKGSQVEDHRVVPPLMYEIEK